LLKKAFGSLYADKSYVYKYLFQMLFEDGLHFSPSKGTK
ncbi:MAG: hypothetical protein ACI97P_001348, partial [Arcticibacterium sp.]